MKAEGKHILHPIGQFRQQFLHCNGTTWSADNYQVFVYPICKYNLEEFKDAHDINNEIMKEIMIQGRIRYTIT